MPGTRGWRWDEANTRLQVFVEGTEVARFDDAAPYLDILVADGLAINGTQLTTDAAQLNALATGYIPVDLFDAREIAANDIATLAAHGGILASDSTPVLERVNTATDKALRINWAAGNDDEVTFSAVTLPPDIDTSAAVEVHLLVARGATTNATTLDVQAFNMTGDTEMGTQLTLNTTTTIDEYTVTLAAANIAAEPGFVSLSLVPGSHANETVLLYGIWIEYTVG